MSDEDFNFDIGSIQSQSSGMDAFFEGEPEIVSPVDPTPKTASAPPRVKIGSLGDLSGFMRVSEDTLVNKSTNELWALKKDDEGKFAIERLFQDDGAPLKGA